MKTDALDAIYLKMPQKIPVKERLNNYELFIHYSGIDPYENLEGAYVESLKRIGIDMVSSVPKNPEAKRINKDETLVEYYGRGKRGISYLGVMPTYSMIDYGFNSVEEVLSFDPEKEDYTGLWLLSGSRDEEEIKKAYIEAYERNCKLRGEYFLTYPYFYTTLFMWCVETFGWEMFMLAAMEDPEAFDALLEKFKRISIKHLKAAEATGADFMVVHDDLAISKGPVFKPEWYQKYIFSKYPEIIAPFKEKGKKVILTSDGNLDILIDDLVSLGIDGFEIETPATDFDNLLRKYGNKKVIIGGIDNRIITFGTPNEVYEHTKEVLKKGRNYPGFIISNTAGFHGNIPLDNTRAYFEAIKKHGRR